MQPVHCSPSAFGLLLHRNRSLALLSAAGAGSRPALRSACKPSPAPLAYSCTAALPSSSSWQLAGLPLLFLWASKSDVRHFAPPLNPPRGFKPFPAPLAYSCIAALPCLCVRREPGERASGTCSPCTAAPAPLAYSCIATAALPSYRQQACPPQRLQTLPSAFGLLLQRSLACVRREPGERALERAARAPIGFQKRR